MKKLIIILAVFISLTSCEKLEKLNENTKDPAIVTGDVLFSNAQKDFIDQIVSTNVNLNIYRLIVQHWTETTYTDESNYDLVTRTIPDNHWDIIYKDVLKDLNESSKVLRNSVLLTASDIKVNNNKLAVNKILSSYAWIVLVETFGNIPFVEALDISKPLPKYDDALFIYESLLDSLNDAIATIDLDYDSYGTADNIYHGENENWVKYANVLKLRIGLVLSDSNPTIAKTAIEEAAPNVFSSNLDNARVVYLNSTPNTNPIYVDLVASGRHDFVPASTLVDTMNALKDPRLDAYFAEKIDTSYDESGKMAYVGGAPGARNRYSQNSHIADAIQEPVFPGTIFSYAEVEFLLAEAVERGYNVTGTAESHYNLGVEASLKEWGVADSLVNIYLANPDVAYSNPNTTYKQKIGLQMWIALYNQGFEAWTQWRKFDNPVLVAPVDAVSDVPLRYTYPIEEQTLNGANYNAASTAIGGDDVATKLFWDKY